MAALAPLRLTCSKKSCASKRSPWSATNRSPTSTLRLSVCTRSMHTDAIAYRVRYPSSIWQDLLSASAYQTCMLLLLIACCATRLVAKRVLHAVDFSVCFVSFASNQYQITWTLRSEQLV
jgi:hypothetical protein